jgi:hypothetical protein
MGLIARIFTANAEDLAQMQRDTRAYLEKNGREIELELLRRKQEQEIIINTLRKDRQK